MRRCRMARFCECLRVLRFFARFCASQRAQRLKKIKILKFSSEIEKFKRSTHQTPVFCGKFWRSRLKFSIEIEIFKRDWQFQARLNFSIFGPLGVLSYQNGLQKGANSRRILQRYAKVGACAMTTKFLDNKIFTFKILLSWRFPWKIAFWTVFLPAPLPRPPLKSANFIFIVVSLSLKKALLCNTPFSYTPFCVSPASWHLHPKITKLLGKNRPEHLLRLFVKSDLKNYPERWKLTN